MQKIKILLLFVLALSLWPFHTKAADECIKETDLKCYEVTAVGNGTVEQIKYKTKPPGINLTSSEANYLWRLSDRISQNRLFVCLFPTDKIPSGVDDADSYGMCDKRINKDDTYGYSCVLGMGGTVNSKMLSTCSYSSDTVRTIGVTGSVCESKADCLPQLECIDKKCVLVDTTLGINASPFTAATEATSSSKSTLPSISAPACNVDCKIGGFFKNVKKDCICCGTCSPDDLLTVANTALEWLFGIVGALGLAMFIYGGFLWVTSRGDSGQVGEGKTAMVNTVIGLLIMFASGAIIVTLQKTIGVQQTVTISGKVTVSESTGTGTAATGTAKSGTAEMGQACSVLPGNDSQCTVGNYCKAVKDGGSVGVCVPKNVQSSLEPGAACYYMPNNDSPSLCKSGKCQTGKTSPVVGDQGKCPEAGKFGVACKSTSECGTDGTCVANICIPIKGRNKQRFEDCYILKGSDTNDCEGALRCIPNIATWKVGDARTAGMSGQCDYIQEIVEGAQCVHNFECQSNICSTQFNRCVSNKFSYPKTVGQSCVNLTEYETGNPFSDCSTGLNCSTSSRVCEAP